MKRCISITIFCLVAFLYSFVSAHWETKDEINTTKKFVKISSTKVLLEKLIEVSTSWESVKTSMIIEELGNREDEKALPVLENILETCNDVFICAVIKIAIKKIKMKDKSKNEKVLHYINLLEDKNTFVVNMAADILRELGSKEAIPALKVQEYRSFNCQKARIKLELQGQNETKKLNLLIEMLKDENKSRLAREILIEIGTSAVSRLVEVLEDKDNPFISRIDALWSLKEIKDKRCVPLLIKILKDLSETDNLREFAAYTLGELRAKEAIPTLEEAIKMWDLKIKKTSKISPVPQRYIYDVGETAKESLKKIREKTDEN